MRHDGRLTVKEILENRNFRDAEVIAGKEGLERTVKWIHIMEVAGIEELLNGNELILSTGVGWKESKQLFLTVFEKLIDSGASGICIELGTYIPSIPNEIIQLANRRHFPLIVFHHKVRFVDITQDVNSLLIKKHYQMISDLEEYSNQLNQLLLTSHSEQKILRFLHEHLKMDVLFTPVQGKVQYLSKQSGQDLKFILPLIKEDNSHIVRREIQALQQKLADLTIISESNPVSEYEKIILDRTATALAQNALRELYFEERRKTIEAEWIQKWLDGVLNEDQIHRRITELEPNRKPTGCIACLWKIAHIGANHLEETHLKILFRSVFQTQGFALFSTMRKNFLVFILVNVRNRNDWKQRMEAGLQQIENTLEMVPQIAVGKFVDKVTEVKKSYQTAEDTMNILEGSQHEAFKRFYDDLYIYRLFSLIGEPELIDFVHDHLGPVINYDRENNGKLLETLKVYLMCNGSKKETASQLFIVRQTLYQRLQKIVELLGEDFMRSPKRQAIEFALTAYGYLSPASIT
ncbi:PucR family transcriptional regulator [Neobacillus sp. OS1-32]|uniref:PucR family transcriptional regulator n=1 Tax=Neobacillus sp. OS1-32 TaxID=3070682 RepID=UPI0027E16F1E|nr:PucR family transcriptional regulator [Neobacillus sp. OS1-32]WML31647.1 PucR family transcriptional regulator [Neobacillus sp. OS1-32]